ncbi:adenylosuccinate synthetase [Polaribacter sp. IC073]|uniref:adenylosuccinate synthetase n=1 Tax=Polaribacter sp. IC073 TaxID=2508540 RepID=UPI0011BF1523|nr:adenylosuccinate synthetase [Polaribacter sp. IC073]TXD49273.1 adenylosuccinate synthetase [Polaribacter sp. IC073]
MLAAIYNSVILQLPIGTPNPDDNKPLDFTDPFEVIVIIIMPILAFLFYIIWRKKRKNRK